jgi:MFS family permease
VALSYLLVQPFAGWLADKYEARTTVLWGIAASALTIVLIPFAKGVPLAFISIVAGLGIGTVWTNSDAAVSLLAKEERLGATRPATSNECEKRPSTRLGAAIEELLDCFEAGSN